MFSVDRGIKDQLLDHNRRFHEHLEGLKIEHHYAELEGGHTWEY